VFCQKKVKDNKRCDSDFNPGCARKSGCNNPSIYQNFKIFLIVYFLIKIISNVKIVFDIEIIRFV